MNEKEVRITGGFSIIFVIVYLITLYHIMPYDSTLTTIELHYFVDALTWTLTVILIGFIMLFTALLIIAQFK